MSKSTSDNFKTILNSQVRDSSAKIIFDDPILCSQFLRDYIDLPFLKNVQPEDIEDVSEQYVTLFAEERNSDRVKKVTIKNEKPFFIISLIEHKAKVEYNVCMQIFRYMVYIWDAYEKEAERLHPGISKRKTFQYPPILPIVYYEGSQKWSAPLNFRSRIVKGELFRKYIPDFQYYLVPIRNYSNEELIEKRDEISLIMMINKLQTLEDIEDFSQLPGEELEAILKGTPDYLVKIIADIMLAFLLSSNVSQENAETMVGRIREKKMSRLFENVKIDFSAAEKRAEKERKRAEKAEARADALSEENAELRKRIQELEHQQNNHEDI